MAKRTKELGLGRGLNALLGDPDLQPQGEGSVSPVSYTHLLRHYVDQSLQGGAVG